MPGHPIQTDPPQSPDPKALDSGAAIAAVVVLYRPDGQVLDNLGSYMGQVARVFAVDNTEEPDASLEGRLRSLGEVGYSANHANLGLATALNQGVRTALGEGYSRVLTMDQDSTATPGMVNALSACLDSDPTIALASPVHQQVGGLPRMIEPGYRDVMMAMTSGNLLRTEAWQSVGGFMEELFIDQVDNEFCLKLHRAGYRVVETGEAVLHHRVGAVRKHHFPFPAFSTNHSALRRYYITRNRFVVSKMYRREFPIFRTFEMAQLRKDILKILLYEGQKLQKFRMILRGFRDYRRGVLGPYPGR